MHLIFSTVLSVVHSDFLMVLMDVSRQSGCFGSELFTDLDELAFDRWCTQLLMKGLDLKFPKDLLAS
jgi:hypothetical protein